MFAIFAVLYLFFMAVLLYFSQKSAADSINSATELVGQNAGYSIPEASAAPGVLYYYHDDTQQYYPVPSQIISSPANISALESDPVLPINDWSSWYAFGPSASDPSSCSESQTIGSDSVNSGGD